MKRRLFLLLGFLGVVSVISAATAQGSESAGQKRGVVAIVPAYDHDLPTGETWQVGP